MDEVGEKLYKVVKVLPKGKVFVTELPLKDPSDMLQQGKENSFLIVSSRLNLIIQQA